MQKPQGDEFGMVTLEQASSDHFSIPTALSGTHWQCWLFWHHANPCGLAPVGGLQLNSAMILCHPFPLIKMHNFPSASNRKSEVSLFWSFLQNWKLNFELKLLFFFFFFFLCWHHKIYSLTWRNLANFPTFVCKNNQQIETRQKKKLLTEMKESVHSPVISETSSSSKCHCGRRFHH